MKIQAMKMILNARTRKETAKEAAINLQFQIFQVQANRLVRSLYWIAKQVKRVSALIKEKQRLKI